MDFNIVAGNLRVTLTNTSTADVLIPTDVLTAVFFTGSTFYSNTAWAGTSAVLGVGSTVLFDSAPAANNVGGEWAYKSGLAPVGGLPLGATSGISAVGFGNGMFGGATFSNGVNLDNPTALGGINYGITSAGDNPLTGNSPVTAGGFPLIKNQVVFTLFCGNNQSGVCAASVLDGISNVSFQYGSALNEPNIPVPEPASLLLLGSALVVGARRLRRRAGQQV